MRVAIVQLCAWGDVLISTCILRAIRQSRRNWHVTYITSSACCGAVFGNPDIDCLEVLECDKECAWSIFQEAVDEAHRRFDKVIAPWPGLIAPMEWLPLKGARYHNFMWSYVRAAEKEGFEIPRPIIPYLHCNDAERRKVKSFWESLPRKATTREIMMEVSGESGQTDWNQQWTERVVALIDDRFSGDFRLFISCGGVEPPAIVQLRQRYGNRIHFMNHFTLREMSLLFNHCHIFFSVSSGTSCACHGHECKRNIKWFEAVNDYVWDSSPLGTMGKLIYHGSSLDAYCSLIADRL